MNRALFKKVLLSVLVLILAGISVGAVQAQNCSNTSTGFIPLFDLAGGTYQGFEGGLYPGGSNHMPSGHLASGLELANQVEPLNSLGQPDPLNGKSVFLSVGMSNTRSEFVSFQQETANDIDKDPQLIVVNGAAGGWAAPQITNPDARFWDDVEDKLSDVGLTPLQVQVVWLKTAEKGLLPAFPQDAQLLLEHLVPIVQNIKTKYPNAKMVYLSTRTYAGYATTNLSPEPIAYQSGFAAKWLIQQQIDGDPELNYDETKGSVKAPWLAWGPYLWTDGVGPDGVTGGIPGRSDGLEWTCGMQDNDGDGLLDSDVAPDGTHPSPAGRIKVTAMLVDFVKNDATARIWYLQSGAGTSLPSAPTQLTATAGDNLVSLSWSASATGSPSSYTMYRSTSSPAGTGLQTGISGTNFTDNTANNGTTYFYRATATNAVGESDFSNEDSAAPAPTTTTGNDVSDGDFPSSIELDQNYPNPFNPSTSISFSLTEAQHVRLTVSDLIGRRIAVLADGVQAAGNYTVTFDADGLPSGVYIYRLETKSELLTRRMIILK